jgi:alkyl hydroperoxide reductase subunit AhpC
MIRIGYPVPNFRVPALAEGALTYFDSAGIKGRCLALSFLPPIGLFEFSLLGKYCQSFDQKRTVFAGVASEDSFFAGPWQRRCWPQGLILLSDPLGRLSRSYGISSISAAARCQSFVIDAEGILRYHLVHDLNSRGLSALLEILKVSQAPSASRLTLTTLLS